MSKRKPDRSREVSQASSGGRSRSRSRSKAPSGVKELERWRDDESREHSDGTVVVESELEEDHQEATPEYYSLPHDIPSCKALMERLRDLRSHPTKKNTVRFIYNQMQIVYARSQIKPIPVVDYLERIDAPRFWDKAVPHMLDSILDCKLKPIALLKSDSKGTVAFTRKEVHSLLSHMFFGTLEKTLNGEYINYGYLFSSVPNWRPEVRLEKLHCLVSYFVQATSFSAQQQAQNIIFERLFDDSDAYLSKKQRLVPIEVTKKNIEEFKGELMVDFANMMIGGGFLKNGAVQEEILFAVCPQLAVSRVFCGIMEPNEAIVVHGFRQYCEYEGYAQTFKFKGVCEGKPSIDIFNKLPTSLIAIDALDFSCFVSTELQYEQSFVIRQIQKAYVGFNVKQWIEETKESRKRIITGKWGCGAFKGDPQLKFILQWLACSWAGRDCVFVNWGPDQKNEEYEQMVGLLKHQKATQLLIQVNEYGRYRKSIGETKPDPLFEYLKKHHK